jgi:hypothetical protein
LFEVVLEVGCLTTLDVLNIPKKVVEKLKSIGVKSVEALASYTPEELCNELGIMNIVLCRTAVARAREFLGLRKPAELVRKGGQSSFKEVFEDLLKKPLFILASTTFHDVLTGNVVSYCIKLYTYSFETRTPEVLIERCYGSVEEADKEFVEAVKIVKQRLGNLVCVQGVDGDCFRFFD